MSVKSKSVLAAIIGALLASTAPVHSQVAPTPQTVDQQFHFKLKKQALRSALARYSKLTGIDIVGDGGLPRDIQSAPLDGTMSAGEALTQLLAGTDLSYNFSSPTSVVILTAEAREARAQVALPEIAVEGQAVANQLSTMTAAPAFAGGQVASGTTVGVFGNRSIFDTPYSIVGFTSEVINNQQATKVGEVLENDPSVRSAYPRSTYDDALTIRGFSISANDFGYNGLFGLASRYGSSTIGIERVELFKGPNTLVNGVPPNGSIGGAVNLITKRAPDVPFLELTGQLSSISLGSTIVDAGRRFGEKNEWGIRFNGSFEKGAVPYNNSYAETPAAFLGIDYRGDRFRWSADLLYVNNETTAGQTGAFFQSPGIVPRAPNGFTNFYQPWTYIKNNNKLAITRAEYDISNDWTVYGAVGANTYNGKYLNGLPTILNTQGDTEEFIGYLSAYRKSFSGEAGIRGRFATGFMEHQVAFGATTIDTEFGISPYVDFGSFTSNIYRPIAHNAPDLSLTADQLKSKLSDAQLTSYVAADTISVLDKRVQFTVGARHQSISTGNYSLGIQTQSYDESAVTPTYAVLVKPLSFLSLYANYIEGLEQGPIAPTGAINVGRVFAPSVAKSKEVGGKVDLTNMGFTLAYFDITRQIGVLDSASRIFSAGQEQRNRGWEVTAFGEPVKGVRVLGGFTALRSSLSGTDGGIYDGNEATGVPRLQSTLRVEWDAPFAKGLTLWGRLLNTSEQYLDQANTTTIPDWTRYDIGARYVYEYEKGKNITLRAAIENVGGLNYWQASIDGYLVQGPGRTYLGSVTVAF